MSKIFLARLLVTWQQLEIWAEPYLDNLGLFVVGAAVAIVRMRSISQAILILASAIFLHPVLAIDYYITSPYSATVWKLGDKATITWDVWGAEPGATTNIDLMNGDDSDAQVVAPITNCLPGSATSFTWVVPANLGVNQGVFIRLTGFVNGSLVSTRYSHRFALALSGATTIAPSTTSTVRPSTTVNSSSSSSKSSSSSASSESTSTESTTTEPTIVTLVKPVNSGASVVSLAPTAALIIAGLALAFFI